jgi:hypothetical protein
MSIISVFFGIIIRIYWRDHNPPDFNASYGEFKAILEIGNLRSRVLPKKARQLVEQWRTKNKKALQEAWNLAFETASTD